MSMNETQHIAVLAEEVLLGLHLKNGDRVIDATLGGGGHTLLMKQALGESGRILSLDMDVEAIARFEARVRGDAYLGREMEEGRLCVAHANFSDIARVAEERGFGEVEVVFADLGYSSDQMDDESRGLSFMKDGPLDMRLDRQSEKTAELVVNTWSEGALAKLFAEAGDEEYARSIARSIVKQRVERAFSGTLELAQTIERSIPARIRAERKTHPATKVFQALRIAVNDELASLSALLQQSLELVVTGGRIGIISFHSGEDRMVKRFFQKEAKGCECPPNFPVCVCGRLPRVRILTAEPIVPKEEEIRINPRARSAKLRIAEKL